jgi:hypothetical protein
MIHAHVAARAYGDAKRRMLTRRCAECGLEQLTPEERLSDTVPCEGCKAPLPPKTADEPGRKRGKRGRGSERRGKG